MVKKIITAAALISLLLACSKSAQTSEEIPGEMNKMEEVLFETIDIFGTVISREKQSVSLGFQCSAIEVKVREGQILTKGTSIIDVDIQMFNLELETKEQALEMAKLELKRLKEEYFENKALFKKKAISGKAYNNSFALYQKAESEIKLQEKELNLQKSFLNNPFISGNSIICPMTKAVIEELRYNQRDYLPSNTTLFTLVNLENLIVQADVPEEFIKDIQIGSKATIIPLADRNLEITGEVFFIASNAQIFSGETIVPILISLDEESDLLLPNFNVDIKIQKEKG